MSQFGAQKTRTHTLKSRHTQNESLFGADFIPEALLGHFSSKISKERPLQSIRDRYRPMLNEFLFTKIEEEDIGNIWFQQDGATRHTAEATLDGLCPVFENRLATLELRFDNVGLLFVECRQR